MADKYAVYSDQPTNVPGLASKLLTDGSVTIPKIAAPIAMTPAGLGAGTVFYLSWNVGGATDIELVIPAELPNGIVILDQIIDVVNGVALSTLQLRTATGGGGAALSEAYATTVTDIVLRRTVRAAGGDTTPIGALFARLSDASVSTVVKLLCFAAGGA